MTLAEFEKMVKNHDLTFMYSDDYSVYSSGQRALDRILAAAKLLPHDDVVRIWNAKVDKELVADARKEFYWRD